MILHKMICKTFFGPAGFLKGSTIKRKAVESTEQMQFSWHSQSNPIELYFNQTQSNSIELNRWIELDWIRQSNEIKLTQKNWTIELNRTFDFQTLDFCKTGVENQ